MLKKNKHSQYDYAINLNRCSQVVIVFLASTYWTHLQLALHALEKKQPDFRMKTNQFTSHLGSCGWQVNKLKQHC